MPLGVHAVLEGVGVSSASAASRIRDFVAGSGKPPRKSTVACGRPTGPSRQQPPPPRSGPWAPGREMNIRTLRRRSADARNDSARSRIVRSRPAGAHGPRTGTGPPAPATDRGPVQGPAFGFLPWVAHGASLPRLRRGYDIRTRARDRNRTCTPPKGPRGLSPLRLPVPPPGRRGHGSDGCATRGHSAGSQAARAGSSTAIHRGAPHGVGPGRHQVDWPPPPLRPCRPPPPPKGRPRTTTETVADVPLRRIVLWTPPRPGGLRKVGTSNPRSRAARPINRAVSANRMAPGPASDASFILRSMSTIFALACDSRSGRPRTKSERPRRMSEPRAILGSCLKKRCLRPRPPDGRI
ncbi:MAG: hypothetical protein Ct9H300mP12_16850 [Acidimicrobiales bacterium]|nr:MAG: hypothetical protein Ct9H300mP12_16850 [Acidimicrobiales bacterium]